VAAVADASPRAVRDTCRGVRNLPALLEAAHAPWVERVAVRLSNVMDEVTAGDVPPVVAWEWACCSPPYLGEKDPHFHHQDARTESRVRDASGILVRATQVESTQIHVSARRDYYVPTLTWWLALEVPYGFPAMMPRIVAYSGTALRRGESTAAAAILATQWVLEVAGVWYASARTKGYLWHLPAGVVDRRVQLHLANMAAGADPEAQAYLSKLLDLHHRWTGRPLVRTWPAGLAGRTTGRPGRFSTVTNASWRVELASMRAWGILHTSMLRG